MPTTRTCVVLSQWLFVFFSPGRQTPVVVPEHEGLVDVNRLILVVGGYKREQDFYARVCASLMQPTKKDGWFV